LQGKTITLIFDSISTKLLVAKRLLIYKAGGHSAREVEARDVWEIKSARITKHAFDIFTAWLFSESPGPSFYEAVIEGVKHHSALVAIAAELKIDRLHNDIVDTLLRVPLGQLPPRNLVIASIKCNGIFREDAMVSISAVVLGLIAEALLRRDEPLTLDEPMETLLKERGSRGVELLLLLMRTPDTQDMLVDSCKKFHLHEHSLKCKPAVDTSVREASSARDTGIAWGFDPVN